jgi:hypothetical protein
MNEYLKHNFYKKDIHNKSTKQQKIMDHIKTKHISIVIIYRPLTLNYNILILKYEEILVSSNKLKRLKHTDIAQRIEQSL